MNFRRIVFLLFVSLTLLLASLCFTAPLWLSKVVESLLVEEQCSEAVVQIDRVGWNNSHIKRLYCKDHKNTFEIDLTDAEISYDLSSLLAKRINHIELNRVAVRLRTSSPASQGNTDIALLTTPAVVLEALPLSSFNIRNIYLQRLNVQGELLQKLSGYAHYSDQGLSLALNEDVNLNGLQLKLAMDKQNGLSAALYQGKIAVFELKSTMHETAEGLLIDGTTDIKLAPLSNILKPWLNMSNQHLEGELHGSWQVSLPSQSQKPLLQQLKLSTSLKLDFALNRPDLGSIRGQLNLDLKFKQGLGIWDITESSQLKFGDRQKTMLDLSGLSGSFSFTEAGWRAAIAEESKLLVKNIRIDAMRISQVQIRLSKPVKIVMDAKGGIKLTEKAALTMVLPTLKWQGNSLFSRNLKLVVHRGSLLTPSGSFRASGIEFTSPTLKLPKGNISGRFALSAKQLSATGELIAAQEKVHLNWQLNYQMLRQKALLAFSIKPLHLGSAGFDLSRVIVSQADYSIDDGVLGLNGRLQWQKGRHKHKDKLGAQFKLKLSNLKGHYKTNLFSGLSGEMLFSGDQNRLLMAPALVTLESLHAGLPVNNISMSAAFTYPFGGLASIEINQFKAEALGGLVSSQKIAIDLGRASNPFLVRLKGLDAGKAVAIRQQEGLTVKGLIDGDLPFDWTGDGLKMTTGELKSTPAGGLIRYLGTESVRRFATTDKATKMVLDILNDFHYKQLNVGADYRPDGELKMSIHLKGSNPGYEKGRAVEFNFNIEENLLKLLQGLAVTGNISDALEKRVQKKLQQE